MTKTSQATPDRRGAEMAHVGIERLAAGDGEDDRAERQESRSRGFGEESDAVERIDRRQDLRALEDVDATRAAPGR